MTSTSPLNGAARTLARPRLVRRMGVALRDGPVLLIAPAGYGKSHLLRALLLQQPHAQHVQLSIEDSDVAQLQARLTPVLMEGATLLLDDIHHLHGATEALAWLNAQRASPSHHFVLSGRMSPDAYWPKRFAVFAADELAFSSAEANTLLVGLNGLTPDMIAQWHARTRGWPLLLSLLARQVDATGFKTVISAFISKNLSGLNTEDQRVLRSAPREIDSTDLLLRREVRANPLHR